MRDYIQRYNNPPVHNFISVSVLQAHKLAHTSLVAMLIKCLSPFSLVPPTWASHHSFLARAHSMLRVDWLSRLQKPVSIRNGLKTILSR